MTEFSGSPLDEALWAINQLNSEDLLVVLDAAWKAYRVQVGIGSDELDQR